MNQFAAHTRSTAFSLTLSQPMIDRVMALEAMHRAREIAAGLASRFPWYEAGTTQDQVFRARARCTDSVAETPDKARLWQMHLSTTEQALARRGLFELEEVHVEDPPSIYGGAPECWRYLRDTLTPAGLKLADLLVAADFERRDPCQFVRSVGPHPDDRLKIRVDGPEPEQPRDRRVDLMLPEDEPFLSVLRREKTPS